MARRFWLACGRARVSSPLLGSPTRRFLMFVFASIEMPRCPTSQGVGIKGLAAEYIHHVSLSLDNGLVPRARTRPRIHQATEAPTRSPYGGGSPSSYHLAGGPSWLHPPTGPCTAQLGPAGAAPHPHAHPPQLVTNNWLPDNSLTRSLGWTIVPLSRRLWLRKPLGV